MVDKPAKQSIEGAPEAISMAEAGPLIHYLSAERDLVRTRGSEERGKGLLALGGPNF